MGYLKKTALIAGILLALVPALAFAQSANNPKRGHFTPPVVRGAVASINGNSITLTGSNGTVYNVDAGNATISNITMASGSKPTTTAITLAQVQTGDTLTVFGTTSGTNITATRIIDGAMPNAIGRQNNMAPTTSASNGTSPTATTQPHKSSFSGSITAVNGSSFTLQTKFRGTQTVNTDSNTTFKKNSQTASLSDIAQGENVNVTGTWDNANNIVTATAVQIIIKTGSKNGTVQAVSGTTITITDGDKITYTVDASSAKLLRRFGAAMQITDFQNGDSVAIQGTINGNNIIATTIRDMSLQAHNGTFVGSVTAVNGSSFTLQSKARGSQTINTNSSTVFKKGNQSGVLTDITVGETVTVTGVWDRTNSNVTATKVTVKVTGTTISGTFQSANGTTLIVIGSNSTTYTVDTSKANFAYKNGHKGDISILQTNDQVTVRGQSVSGSTTITASLVRDTSQTYKKPVPTPAAASTGQ